MTPRSESKGLKEDKTLEEQKNQPKAKAGKQVESDELNDPDKLRRDNADRISKRDSRDSVSLQRPLNKPREFGK